MSQLAGLIAAAGFADDLPVSLAVVDASGCLHAAVAGLWPNGHGVAAGDRFYGASLAKQITGAAAGLLVRDGLLDPDAPIDRWLDGLPPWLGAVTTRQLAHHTAGLPEAGVAEAALDGWTEPSVTRYLATLDAPVSPPGTEHRYSNLGYILLARLVATVAGQPFADFVASRLADNPAISFTSTVGSFPQATLLGKPPLTRGDGGLWASATALADWLARQNRDPLRIAAITEQPGRLSDGTAVEYGWGLGLRRYRGERLLIHGGSWTGASCKTTRCPALGLAVAVLTAGGEMPKVVELADAALEFAYSSASSAVR